MARKVKFPLDLRDGYLARSNIEEVRAHFDLEKIIAQFHNGRLKIWLDDHYLPEMAEQVAALDGDAPDLAAQLCAVLGVEGVATEHVDSSLIQKREEKRQRLSQYTTNPILCDMAEYVAFEQKDLDALIDEGAREIILCNNAFRIPLLAEKRKYYGVGKVVAVIDSDTPIDFAARGIEFTNVPFDEKYTGIVEKKKQRNRLNTSRAERRALITPDVLAELCSVLMLGKLENGNFLWKDQRSWSNGFNYQVHSSLPRMSPSFHQKISSRNEIVIGYGQPNTMYGSVDIILLTDKSVYLSDKTMSLDVAYSDIENVIFKNGTRGVFQVCTADGKKHELPNTPSWYPRVRLNSLRLFLLVMARLFGHKKYCFTSTEQTILKEAKLRLLGNKSILKFL